MTLCSVYIYDTPHAICGLAEIAHAAMDVPDSKDAEMVTTRDVYEDKTLESMGYQQGKLTQDSAYCTSRAKDG